MSSDFVKRFDCVEKFLLVLLELYKLVHLFQIFMSHYVNCTQAFPQHLAIRNIFFHLAVSRFLSFV